MVRFLFSPNDFKAPKLLANMDVYYYDCTQRGTLVSGVAHDCTRGPNWLNNPCVSRWKILGEPWIECRVVAANGCPLEKWRGIVKYTIPGIREESYIRELVWKSPFSNSLSMMGPSIPRGGWVEWADEKHDHEYGIRCKIGNGKFLLPPLAGSYIKRHYEFV